MDAAVLGRRLGKLFDRAEPLHQVPAEAAQRARAVELVVRDRTAGRE
ncbi:hypothetical protein G3I59_34530 [Amycolatopsis rubida]|uniref:Uncharacterized protein n=1 Tax=Amycolatopsis rubida TaxID=112413 RepID=A0ABX0C6G7_9PSEU|nr:MULTISPECIES: hypothetical protein [Amycolatopsis]MYW95576.1 hypothetical protein [Amycolatopsis rubida]NEC60565.1 hypothetical protein [Amycolatopsis rubida]